MCISMTMTSKYVVYVYAVPYEQTKMLNATQAFMLINIIFHFNVKNRIYRALVVLHLFTPSLYGMSVVCPSKDIIHGFTK